MIRLGLFEQAQPIIGAAVEIHHFGVAFEQFDRRQEAAPLQSVLVQRVRRNVRGRDERDTFVEQMRKQFAEDHRVADVRDEELVETQHARFARQTFRDELQADPGVRQIASGRGGHGA